ncbi:MAG: class I SAM-dependent methyltransferase [Bacteroidota bacterium]
MSAINNFFGDMDLFLLDWVLKGKVVPGSRILDVGCGEGRNAVYFLQNEFDYTGIDPDESKIQLIEFLNRQFTTTKARFLVGELATFQSPDLFDFIVCSRVLHFSKNEEEFLNAIQALAKLLTKEGLLYVAMDSVWDASIGSLVDANHHQFPDGKVRFALTFPRYQHFLKFFTEEEAPRTLVHHGERAQSFLLLKKT